MGSKYKRFLLIMELFELYQTSFLHVIIITILLLTIFPLRSYAFACITCMFPIFHPLCCCLFHTCCDMKKNANATAS
ncbi:hypothetical protein NPIL_143971 [Nephila pilipes]|uniref:Uncharacterized protein n=1 Tax=Nephila pilipes TaxID=299642 RepID=A0A8X6MPL3_NEPPI|nr:hypothetical protein NPIL_143971 [Nephila pilipes]